MGAVNFITTIIGLRAPGMTMFRMPIFTWNILFTSILVLLTFPVLAAAMSGLWADRLLGSHIYDPSHGGELDVAAPVLVLRASRGLHRRAAVLRDRHQRSFPVFSRKPLFGYIGMVFATITITGLSMTVWAHHMFTTGLGSAAVLLLPARS